MTQIARLIGGAGTGKTTELLRIMEQLLERIHDPHLIGFVSFTKAARAEAAGRAASLFGTTTRDLEVDGWFRTLHSVCHKCLGVKQELLSDNAESRQWVQDAIQDALCTTTTDRSTDYAEAFTMDTTDAGKALALWDCARNRLEPYEAAWREAEASDDRTPDLTYCLGIVDRYEAAKRVDHRLDFTDLLGRFSGWQFHLHPAGHSQGTPCGDPPELPVWLFDEQQDASALLDAVCRRLISTETCQWVYVVGDPFQAIYGWAGADPKHFRAWPADKERVMPKSYRCPAPVLAIGERLLQGCSDYWDRKIEPADHAGTVDDAVLNDDLFDEISPAESWLLLARTNHLAARMASHLDKRGIPWLSTRGTSTWAAPVRNMAIQAMLALEVGAPISGDQWQAVLKYLPSSDDGTQFLARGTKSRFEALTAEDAASRYPWIQPHELDQLGATPELLAAIQTRTWRPLIPESENYAFALQQWGHEAVVRPNIRVGTIHSVKGAEADNVAVLTTLSAPCFHAAQSTRGFDEEQRVFYVAVTRARKRLYVIDEIKPQYRKRIDL